MTPKEYLDKKFSGGKPRKCWMCKCVLPRGEASVDHLQPRSKGGRNKEENFAIACKSCNLNRGNAIIKKDVRLAVKGREKPKGRDFSGLALAIQKARRSGNLI